MDPSTAEANSFKNQTDLQKAFLHVSSACDILDIFAGFRYPLLLLP